MVYFHGSMAQSFSRDETNPLHNLLMHVQSTRPFSLVACESNKQHLNDANIGFINTTIINSFHIACSTSRSTNVPIAHSFRPQPTFGSFFIFKHRIWKQRLQLSQNSERSVATFLHIFSSRIILIITGQCSFSSAKYDSGTTPSMISSPSSFASINNV